MTMLQEQAVQMIQDMSDDNVGFLIEVMQSWKQHFEYTAGGLIRGADVKGYGWIHRRV